MALIVEDGTGLAGAESYASVAEGLTYLTRRQRHVDWAALDEAVAEGYLVAATDWIDCRFSYLNDALVSTQARVFPRTGGIGLPVAVKNACIELADRARTVSLMPDPTHDAGGRVLRSSKKVGPISKEVEYTGGGVPLPAFPFVERMLAPYRARMTVGRA